MKKAKMSLIKVELNSAEIKAFLADPALREPLYEFADAIEAAIPASDGPPGVAPKKGERQTNGRYSGKYQDREAVALDGRVAVDVGVEEADRGFFRLMTLQKAIRSIGARQKRKK